MDIIAGTVSHFCLAIFDVAHRQAADSIQDSACVFYGYDIFQGDMTI